MSVTGHRPMPQSKQGSRIDVASLKCKTKKWLVQELTKTMIPHTEITVQHAEHCESKTRHTDPATKTHSTTDRVSFDCVHAMGLTQKEHSSEMI
jgi:hypothetical protein